MDFTIDNSTLILAEKEIVPKVIPVLITIACLTLLGVFGNAIVIYVFGFSLKGSNINFFIFLLAIFDIICCAVVFPMEMVEFYYSLRYPSNVNCIFQRLFTFTCLFGSVTMLIIISIERYRKVCRAALSELSSLHRKILTTVVVVWSLTLASPIVVYSKRRLFIHHLYPNMTAAICSLPSFDRSPFPQYYLMTLFIFISVALVAMLICYYRVWRIARKHFIMAHERRQRQNCTGAEVSLAQKRLNRTNRTLIATTVLFALSFFPSLLLTILVLKLPPFLHTFSVEIVYFTLVRLYTLNSSFNPLVYGYFNEQFRYETKKMLSKILNLKEPKTLNFSSDNTDWILLSNICFYRSLTFLLHVFFCFQVVHTSFLKNLLKVQIISPENNLSQL